MTKCDEYLQKLYEKEDIMEMLHSNKLFLEDLKVFENINK